MSWEEWFEWSYNPELHEIDDLVEGLHEDTAPPETDANHEADAIDGEIRGERDRWPNSADPEGVSVFQGDAGIPGAAILERIEGVDLTDNRVDLSDDRAPKNEGCRMPIAVLVPITHIVEDCEWVVRNCHRLIMPKWSLFSTVTAKRSG